MKHVFFRRFVFLVLPMALVACSSLPTTSSGIQNGSILLTPPRNVVQNGKPHEEGKDSGQHLEEILKRKLNSSNKFEVIVSESDKFSHEKPVDPNDAREVARAKNADYFLIIILGEFRDAAPMTFRSDFVTLEHAALYKTSTDKTVWKLTEPYKLDKSNLGSYYTILNSIAHEIANDLNANVK